MAIQLMFDLTSIRVWFLSLFWMTDAIKVLKVLIAEGSQKSPYWQKVNENELLELAQQDKVVINYANYLLIHEIMWF